MKKFWPRRSDVRGFLIKNIPSKYREKIYRISFEKSSNQFLDDRNIKYNQEYSNHKYSSISPLFKKKGHWANRDFSEYKDAA